MTSQPGGQGQQVPPFDPAKPHHAAPRIRPSIFGQPVPVKTPDGQQHVMLALSDRSQLAEGSLVTSPLAQFMVGFMNGENEPASIAASAVDKAREAGAPEEALAQITEDNVRMLVAQLDNAGLLQGPVFDERLAKLRADFDGSDILPPGTTAAMAEAVAQAALGEGATEEAKKEQAPARLREAIDKWIDDVLKPAEDPSFNELPRLIIVPHLDYWRGYMNLAQAYGRMRVVDRPARVIVLGVNHFGFGTGVVGCNKGYETPLGITNYDADFGALIEGKLGSEDTEKLYAARYDHEREHSIELQIPWVQHIFGAGDDGPKVWGALVHNPIRNSGESYDGNGLGIQPFIDALKASIGEAPGRTLVIVSANLSHVGPVYGDKREVMGDSEEANAFRKEVVDHDMELLEFIKNGKPEELVAMLAWQQNPTRWNAVGSIIAGMHAVEASGARLLNYLAAGDQQGRAVISSVAMVVE